MTPHEFLTYGSILFRTPGFVLGQQRTTTSLDRSHCPIPPAGIYAPSDFIPHQPPNSAFLSNSALEFDLNLRHITPTGLPLDH